MEIKIRPKTIIIVGGATGIGYATAQKILDNGCSNVILASRNLQKLETASKSLQHTPDQKISVYEFDISDVKSHNEMIQGVHNELKVIPDGLIISSGVNFDGSNWKGFNISENDYDKVMDINLKGVFFLIRNFSNYLFSHQCKGNICVVSSISAHRDLLSVYQISKNAISGIVHAYGKHLYERGIVLNGVEPGTIHTDMMKHLSGYTDGIREGKPWSDNSIGRLLRADEIADIICFLISNLGEAMAGSCILAGGGCKTLSW